MIHSILVLRVDDVVLGADGRLSTLTGTLRVEVDGGIAVFNFTVEGNHNYFVLSKDFGFGQSCVLVHNAGKFDMDCGAKSSDIPKRTGAGRSDPHGDGGRAAAKADAEIKKIREEIARLKRSQEPGSKKLKKDLQKKIQDMLVNAARARKGETHWRRGK